MRKHKIAIALCMLPFSFALAQEVVKGKVIPVVHLGNR